jgi:hypothetical protein
MPDDQRMSQEDFLNNLSDMSSAKPSPMAQPGVTDNSSPDGKMSQEEFLNYISQIESSGGKNTKHPTVHSGVNAGSNAIGKYGLMPNTVRDTVKRGVASGDLPQDMSEIASRDDAGIKNLLSNYPASETMIANSLAHRVLNKYNDPNMAAYSWNQGTNLTPDQIKQRDFMNSDYVQKFGRVQNMLGKK